MNTVFVTADGREVDLATLGPDDLQTLADDQEFAYAARIRASAKGSPERQEAITRGYDLVCAALMRLGHESMGFNPRFARLAQDLLAPVIARDGSASFFEVGFGAGAMLKAIRSPQVRVAGIEASPHLVACAREQLGDGQADLHQGLLVQHTIAERFDVVYWNDVAEHLHPDEIGDYLGAIHALLKPGGRLITVTPNWHTRPWDATRRTKGVRHQAEGFHLKEYTLREMHALLGAVGFTCITVPLIVTRRRIWLARRGLIGLKRLCEPLLEFLPYTLAWRGCTAAGMHCTVATRP